MNFVYLFLDAPISVCYTVENETGGQTYDDQ